MPQDQPYRLRDGSETLDRRLDRLVRYDPRSLSYRVKDALSVKAQLTPVNRRWTAPAATPVLNQGAEGQCVGYAITHELLYYPVAVKGLTGVFAQDDIYWPAQRADPWEGGSYPGASPVYEGTSVLFGIKAAADLGYYLEYRWATSELEMRSGVGHLGPAIIGVDWYNGMFKPNANGFLKVTGGKAGGHCILVIAVNLAGHYYIVHNSWGPGWGDRGNAKISFDDMAALLAANGECAIITRRALPSAVPAA